jgi:hypothetical protein
MLCAVGQGASAASAPRLVSLRYDGGAKGERPVVLVGKVRCGAVRSGAVRPGAVRSGAVCWISRNGVRCAALHWSVLRSLVLCRAVLECTGYYLAGHYTWYTAVHRILRRCCAWASSSAAQCSSLLSQCDA